MFVVLFFFKQKTAYEMRISDWSSDVCSSDLMQLEILDALFLEFVGGQLETRIGQLVAFESGIVESRFVDQMPALVRFAQDILAALFRIGIGKLWHGNVRLAPHFLNRENGRAHVYTPVPHQQHVLRLTLEKPKHKTHT